jgi:hypothetical protein
MKSLLLRLFAIALGVTSLTAFAQYNNHPNYRDVYPQTEHHYRDNDYGYRKYHYRGNDYGYRKYPYSKYHRRHPGPTVWQHPHKPSWWCDWRDCWYQPHYPRY